MKLVALALAATLATQPAMAADRFDLICKGTRAEALDSPGTPAAVHLRIDMPAGKFCRGDCKEILSVHDVTDDRMTLQQVEQDATHQEYTVSEWLNRRSNEYSYEWTQIHPQAKFEKITALCTVAGFSGFPHR